MESAQNPQTGDLRFPPSSGEGRSYHVRPLLTGFPECPDGQPEEEEFP